MGIFYNTVAVVNRAPESITVRFDGQDISLPPGDNQLPECVIPFGKNQNPIMGSQDPNNPHISGADYLLAVPGEDNCTPLTPEQWADHLGQPCRQNAQDAFNEKYGSDPKAKLITLGKGRKSTAMNRSDAGSSSAGLATFEKDK